MATLTVKTKFSFMKFECEQYNYKKGGSSERWLHATKKVDNLKW